MAKQFAGRAQGAWSVHIDGSICVAVGPREPLIFVLEIKMADGKITGIDMIADQDRIRRLDLAVLND